MAMMLSMTGSPNCLGQIGRGYTYEYMKVLLIATNRERSPQTLIPLGVCCIASAAEAEGYDVSLLDLCFSRQPVADVEREISRIQPDTIGLSVRNLDTCDSLSPRSYLPEIKQIVDACRRRSEAEIILGGSAISQSPKEVARYLGCKISVMGEGEISFIELLRAIERGDDPTLVQGVITTMASGSVVSNAPKHAAPGAHPDPNPAKWLDLRRYAASDAAMPIQTKRGCEFHCSYCTYPLLEGHSFRLYEPEEVSRQVVAAGIAGMRGIEFVDSVFGFPQAHSIACCESIAQVLPRGMTITSLELNPCACTPELIDAMNSAGFTTVGVTAESGSNAVLKSMNKNFTSDDLQVAEQNLRRLHARKMWIFMFGAPGETEQTVRETVNFMENLPHTDLVMITHGIRVYPRTALRQRLVNDGLIDPHDDLVEPRFYYSHCVTPEQVNRILAESSFPANNIVTLTDCGHHLAPMLQWLASITGMKPPYWRGLPTINRARRLLRL